MKKKKQNDSWHRKNILKTIFDESLHNLGKSCKSNLPRAESALSFYITWQQPVGIGLIILISGQSVEAEIQMLNYI